MDIYRYTGNDAVLRELGERIQSTRVSLNYSQKEFAARTGLSLKTISRLENGENVQMSAYISVLRELNLLENLNLLISKPELRPTEIMDRSKPSRKRVSGSKRSEKGITWKDDQP